MIRPATTDRAQLIARAFASFPHFCGLLQIQPKKGQGRIPFVTTPLQAQYNAARTYRDNVLKGRQVYITSNECARDVHHFLTVPGAHVVVVVQSQEDQQALKDVSGMVALYIDCLRNLGVQLKMSEETTTSWAMKERDATLRVVVAGASKTSASKKGRGGRVTRLHLSEMAFWGDSAEDTFNSLIESVPRDGGEVVNESTPNGATGYFHEMWEASVTGQSVFTAHFLEWFRHHEYRLPLDDGETIVPKTKTEEALVLRGASTEAIKWRREKIREKSGKEKLVNQEYPNDPVTCFLLSGRTFFEEELVTAAFTRCMPPIHQEKRLFLRIWEQPVKGRTYVISADTSEGGGGDPSAALVFCKETREHVATIHGQIVPSEYADVLAAVGREYNWAEIAVERNNHGGTVLTCLFKLAYPNIYWHLGKKPGFPTNNETRTPMLDLFDAGFREGHFATRDAMVLGEMRTMTVVNRGVTQRAEASSGAHDDLVIAAAIGWCVMLRPQKRGAVPEE